MIHLLGVARLWTSARVGQAMNRTDREHYVGRDNASVAYVDRPIGIGHGVTISAPHMHAIMLQELEPWLTPGANVLDVGSGSGYLSVAMAMMVSEGNAAGRCVALEYIEPLMRQSMLNIRADGKQSLMDNGTLVLLTGDGWAGVPSLAPFDAIHVGAAAVEIPQALVSQLKPGGKMVVPVGAQDQGQVLTEVVKDHMGKVTTRSLMGVRFVPLVRSSPFE